LDKKNVFVFRERTRTRTRTRTAREDSNLLLDFSGQTNDHIAQ
jgi:hypothetical protein